MDISEEQFNTLIAELAVRANKALSVGVEPPPIALGLDLHGNSRVILGVADSGEQLAAILGKLTSELSALAHDNQIVASCVARFDKDGNCIVADLENLENYCARVFIPISVGSNPTLDLEEMVVEDGYISIFPPATH